MKRSTLYSTEAFIYYCPLLHRYARRMLHNNLAAASLVVEVLQEYIHYPAQPPGRQLRQQLKAAVYNQCQYTIQADVFNRSPAGIPLANRLPAVETASLSINYSCDATNR